MGTQTLIQALQALPWADADNDDDEEQDTADSESDDEGDRRGLLYLSYVNPNELVTLISDVSS